MPARCDLEHTQSVLALAAPSHAQIRYRDDPKGVLDAAARLGAGRARPALELVGFDGGVQAAMKYVFGNTFVCQVRGGLYRIDYWGGDAAATRR